MRLFPCFAALKTRTTARRRQEKCLKMQPGPPPKAGTSQMATCFISNFVDLPTKFIVCFLQSLVCVLSRACGARSGVCCCCFGSCFFLTWFVVSVTWRCGRGARSQCAMPVPWRSDSILASVSRCLPLTDSCFDVVVDYRFRSQMPHASERFLLSHGF